MGRRNRERKLRIEQGLEQSRGWRLFESAKSKFLERAKSRFLETLVSEGVEEVECLVVTGKVKKDVPVDLEKELIEAKAKVGFAGDTLGITDDDLREVLRRVCKKCGLEVKI